MQPVTFDNCFGLYSPGRSHKGVVICNSFGLEEVRYRGALAELSTALSERGLHVLRFDYSGAGYPAGTSLDPGILRRWSDNATSACEWLIKHAGVEQISYIGLRLGAIVAVQACNAGSVPEELVLMAPPASGRSLVAEMTRSAGAGIEEDLPAGFAQLPFEGVDMAGFRLGRQTLDELEQFEWGKLTSCPARKIIVLAENRGEDRQLIADAFVALNRPVETNDTLEGFGRALSDMRAASRATPHWSAIAHLLSIPGGAPGVHPVAPPIKPMAGPGYLETPVYLTSNEQFAGIFSRASSGKEQGAAVLMLPSAEGQALHWPRLRVDLARRLARSGIACLRLQDPASSDLRIFETPARQLQAAVSWLKGHRYGDIAVLGGSDAELEELTLVAGEHRVARLLLLDKPPMRTGTGLAQPDVRKGDAAAAAQNPGSIEARIPETMRAISHSVESLQQIRDLAGDRDTSTERFERQMEAFANTGRPLAVMGCRRSLEDLVPSGLTAWVHKFTAAESGPRTLKPDVTGCDGPTILSVDSQDGMLATDAARAKFGALLIEYVQRDTARTTPGVRLALQAI